MSSWNTLSALNRALPIVLVGLTLIIGARAVINQSPGPSEPSEEQDVHAAAPTFTTTVPGLDSDPYATLLAPPPPPAVRTTSLSYVIQDGDTLLTISEHFALRPDTLVWANDLDDPDLIVSGQTLRIPPRDGVYYRVQPGDGLASIANRFDVDMLAVASANGIDNPDHVSLEAELFLPDGRAPADLIAAPSVAVGDPTTIVASRETSPNTERLLSSGWLRVAAEGQLVTSAGPGAGLLSPLPVGASLERAGGVTNGRVLVRDPGDGRTRQAMTGWVDASTVEPGAAPSSRELPRSYPLSTRMDIAHSFVPFRTQLDGSPWAAANCGPSALGMVLESFGNRLSSAQLRSETLAAQGFGGNYVGTLLTALAQVGERHGIRALDLYTEGELKRWSLDDVRGHVRAGHPVIAQVHYARLPGRERVANAPDHYIVITGVVDDGFLYNDSIDSDGLGWDRVISGDRLYAAMEAGDKRFRYAAFAAARAGA